MSLQAAANSYLHGACGLTAMLTALKIGAVYLAVNNKASSCGNFRSLSALFATKSGFTWTWPSCLGKGELLLYLEAALQTKARQVDAYAYRRWHVGQEDALVF